MFLSHIVVLLLSLSLSPSPPSSPPPSYPLSPSPPLSLKSVSVSILRQGLKQNKTNLEAAWQPNHGAEAGSATGIADSTVVGGRVRIGADALLVTWAPSFWLLKFWNNYFHTSWQIVGPECLPIFPGPSMRILLDLPTQQLSAWHSRTPQAPTLCSGPWTS